MSLSATYNTITLNPLQRWREEVTPIFNSAGKDVTGYRHVFRLEGYLSATDASGRATNITSLLTKLRDSGETLTITQDGTAIRTFQASDVKGSAPFPSYEIPADVPTKLGYLVPIILTIEGETDPTGGASGTVAHTYTDTYEHDKQNRRTFTRQGHLETDSSTSAAGKFSGVDPTSVVATGDWELDHKSYDTDEDDQELTYTYVYVEQHLVNPTSAADVEFTLSSTIEESLEQWVCAGVVRFALGTTIDRSQVKAVLKSAGFPTDAKVTREEVTENLRDNSLTFMVQGMKGYGQNGTTAFERRVETVGIAGIAIIKALASSGKDVRQTLTNPDITITDSGSWSKTGGYASFPTQAFNLADLTETRLVQLKPKYDVKGRGLIFTIEWTYVGKPLNQVQAGYFPNVTPMPTTDAPQSGAGSGEVISE